jgi:hypothetical protein
LIFTVLLVAVPVVPVFPETQAATKAAAVAADILS